MCFFACRVNTCLLELMHVQCVSLYTCFINCVDYDSMTSMYMLHTCVMHIMYIQSCMLMYARECICTNFVHGSVRSQAHGMLVLSFYS